MKYNFKDVTIIETMSNLPEGKLFKKKTPNKNVGK